MSRNTPFELELPKAPYATHSSPRGDVRAQPYHTRQQSAALAEDALHSFDDVDITGFVQPPPSALTSATAYDPHSDAPSPLQDYPQSARSSHQRTLTGTLFDNCQPFLNRATTTLQQHTTRASLHSPTKSLASFIPSRSAIESSASQPKIRALQNWFNGSSAPVKLGVSSQPQEYSDSESESGEEYDSEEEEEEEKNNMMANIFNRGSSLTRGSESPRRSEDTPTPTKAPSHPNAGSKFAWLLSTQKNAVLPPPISSPTYHNPDDELLNLSISQALFPHGPADPLAPSSFHDLLTNAEALLSRYQASYRQVSTSLVDARSELSAQEDELDEADTRVRHLKMQLETMAARANEQDEQMRRLMEDLAFERRARQEEEAARKRSLALIRGPSQCEHNACQDTPRRRNRISNSEISVDSGFESEAETDAASVFSRNCLSPTGTDQSSILEGEVHDATPKGRKPQLVQRRSTYEKVREGAVDLKQGGWGCANCEGGAQAAVWGRLAKEREENRTLRHRVETLEEAVEGALNVVDGPWGM
ncbi:Nn.00g066600.m01.CDS01 [Neocucurbitaria sp. VM-36]